MSKTRIVVIVCLVSACCLLAYCLRWNETSEFPLPTLPASDGEVTILQKSGNYVLIVFNFKPEEEYYSHLPQAQRRDYFLRRAIQLVRGPGATKYPAETSFKIYGVLLTDRNEYGHDNWGSIRKIGEFSVDFAQLSRAGSDVHRSMRARELPRLFSHIEWLGSD